MKANITGHETVLTLEIKKYTEQKLNKLCKRYKQIQGADVVLEEKPSKVGKAVATAKVLLKIKGQDISATADSKNVFAAVDELERKLVKQLDREKAKKDPNNSRILRSKKMLQKLFRMDR